MEFSLSFALLTMSLWFTYTDLKSRVIPNKITHWALLILLIIRVPNPEFYLGLMPAVLLFVVWFISPRSLGAGDVKLIAMVGLCLGLSQTINVLFWTMLLSSCIFIVFWIIKKRKDILLPLAPIITVGIILTLTIRWPIV